MADRPIFASGCSGRVGRASEDMGHKLAHDPMPATSRAAIIDDAPRCVFELGHYFRAVGTIIATRAPVLLGLLQDASRQHGRPGDPLRRDRRAGLPGRRDGPDDLFGKPIGAILGKYAIGTPPEGSTTLNPRLLVRAIRMALGWRLRGKTWPHPFFDRATRGPSRPLTTLSHAERDALRPLCGPHPTA